MTNYTNSWRPPSIEERNVLRRLAATEFDGSNEVLQQIEECSVREIDANGSLAITVSPTRPLAAVRYRVPAEGEYQDIDGIAVHVLLHIVDGRVAELELYKEDNTAIQDRDGLEAMSVFAV